MGSNPTLSAMNHDQAMRLALTEARAAVEHEDVPVGALVIVGDEVVSSRHNERQLTGDPTAHAEILALRDAANQLGTWRLDGATLVSTLEPCPMCAGEQLTRASGMSSLERMIQRLEQLKRFTTCSRTLV